jgi:hypothetical protein
MWRAKAKFSRHGTVVDKVRANLGKTGGDFRRCSGSQPPRTPE